ERLLREAGAALNGKVELVLVVRAVIDRPRAGLLIDVVADIALDGFSPNAGRAAKLAHQIDVKVGREEEDACGGGGGGPRIRAANGAIDGVEGEDKGKGDVRAFPDFVFTEQDQAVLLRHDARALPPHVQEVREAREAARP